MNHENRSGLEIFGECVVVVTTKQGGGGLGKIEGANGVVAFEFACFPSSIPTEEILPSKSRV